MNLNITYDGGLSAIAEKISANLSDVIEAGANAVREEAKAICPVDTGALQSSIAVSVNGNTAQISANTDYAAFVEFGTSKMMPQPYLVPSLLANTGNVLEAMADAIGA